MTKELVTVVVPVYNVEKYLEQCISSIVNQTYTNLEIVLVDDGSLDCCPQICDEWAKKDGRIKVIHKENAGLGMARNTGIENASGKYICFFDSDDYVAPDTIEKAYAKISKEKADIALFGFYIVNDEGKIIGNRIADTPKEVYEGSEVQEEFLINLISVNPDTGCDWKLQMSACMCLVSLELIKKNNFKFFSERQIISEDVFFLLGLYKYVTKVVVVKEGLYFYRQNNTSLTRTYRHDRYDKIKQFYDSSVELCQQCGYSDQVKRQLIGPYISFAIAAMKLLVNSNMSSKEKKETMKKIVRDEHLYRIVNQIDMQRETMTRRVLFYAIKQKQHRVVYLLIKAKA